MSSLIASKMRQISSSCFSSRFSSSLSFRANPSLDAIIFLNWTKALMIAIFTSIARSLFSTDDNIATPCSVKAKGRYFECWPRFKVTFCDLKARFSSSVNSNIKSSGKRSTISDCGLRIADVRNDLLVEDYFV
mgnify:CR=1 FL=1